MADGWSGREAQRLVALTLDTYGTTCHLCGGPGATSADHIIPRRDGGSNALSNLRPSHLLCNIRRGRKPLSVWFAKHPLPITKPAPPSREW